MSSKIGKYYFLTVEKLFLPDQSQIKQQGQFAYSLLGKAFEKQQQQQQQQQQQNYRSLLLNNYSE